MSRWHGWALLLVGVGLAVALERHTFAAAELAPALALAALLYAGSHGLRLLRLVALLGHASRSVRRIALAHLVTAPVAALVPFKLGELVRIGAFSAESQSPVHAIGAVWAERTFDAVVLAAMAGVTAWLYPELAGAAAPVAVLASSLLVLTGLALFVLPENIDAAKHFLILRYTSQTSLALIKAVHALGSALDLARGIVQGKIATLLALTVFIWVLEAAALGAMAGALATASPGLLAVLSDVFLPLAQTTPGLAENLATHHAMVLSVLLGLAGCAAVALSMPAMSPQPAGAR